jgi:hypothetical protein
MHAKGKKGVLASARNSPLMCFRSFARFGHGLGWVQRLTLVLLELGSDNSLCLIKIERRELHFAGFTDADYGNVLRYDLEITFCHVAPL